MTWIELSVRAEPEAVEPVAELFSRLGRGVAIEEPLAGTDETGAVVIDSARPVVVKTYVPLDEGSDETIRATEEALWHLSQLRHIEPLEVRKLAEEDWAEAWKEHFFVQRIGSRIVIKPSWRECEARAGDVVVELDPGMAFGTGLHPTTRSCLLACERYLRPGSGVMDLGTGSGILAIAAAKLGASRVVALDLDQVAVEVARKNVASSNLAAVVEVRAGTLTGEEGSFDLVLANLIAGAIIDLARRLSEAIGAEGVLVASGIIDAKEQPVSEALEAVGLKVDEVVAEGDWRTLVCSRG